ARPSATSPSSAASVRRHKKRPPRLRTARARPVRPTDPRSGRSTRWRDRHSCGSVVNPDTIGIDLGGTHLRIALVDRTGAIGHDLRLETPKDGWRAVLTALADGITKVTAAGQADGLAVGAVGIGIAALVDDDGVARYAPNLHGLVDVPLRGELESSVGLPVAVDNDANVAARGELAHGAARGARHALMLTLGTGIGGGIILDGKVYRGAHGFAAEVGHWQFDPHGRMC